MENTYATKHFKKVAFCTNCISGKYEFVSFANVPTIIKMLSVADQEVLSIFYIETGKYVHQKSGYRIRTGPLSLKKKEQVDYNIFRTR